MCQQEWDKCKATYHTYLPPSLDSCPTEETICDVEEEDEDCTGNKCVICLSEEGAGPCMVVEGVDSESDCESLVGCELPDGSLRFDLTEEECEEVAGACTADCEGQSCRSVDGLGGCV